MYLIKLQVTISFVNNSYSQRNSTLTAKSTTISAFSLYKSFIILNKINKSVKIAHTDSKTSNAETNKQGEEEENEFMIK